MDTRRHVCGCYYIVPPSTPNFSYRSQRRYLPQVDVKARSQILSTTSRTTLTQKFVSPSDSQPLKEVRYTFPLYDGVTVVGFTCRIDDRVIIGIVKEREKAKADFKAAVAKGQTAGLLEQLPDAADVFTTTLGNIPQGAVLVVEITYLGELKHDAEVDGTRFTIPTSIAPRYGSYPGELVRPATASSGRFELIIDAEVAESSFIRSMQSPSHPIAVSLGTTSTAPHADPSMQRASATLTLGSAEMDKDFVLQVITKDQGMPTALLERHPTIPNQRALMATLVPKFSLPAEKPEIVFICDCSGSMAGQKMKMVVSALKVFLRSLPVGIRFNLCSFGSDFEFLWPKSKAYSQSTLDEATAYVERMDANFGGTEMFKPVKATLDQRYRDISLEVMLLTDGEIWNQNELFTYLNKEVGETKAPIRVFSLGVGNDVSHSLIEGIARAGNGFSQAVMTDEKLDSKVVRMLKGALSPHVNDYTLEVRYASTQQQSLDADDAEFEIIEKVMEGLTVDEPAAEKPEKKPGTRQQPISLFDTSANSDGEDLKPTADDDGQARYDHLPAMTVPKLLQAPHHIPPLFPFTRTTIYLLLSPQTWQRKPSCVVLRGTSTRGPLELEIPVQEVSEPGETIHQLAAKKLTKELEEGRGWLHDAKVGDKLLKEKYESRFEEMVEREAVRLGVQYQVGGKWCSFVAVEGENAASADAGLSPEPVFATGDGPAQFAQFCSTAGAVSRSIKKARSTAPAPPPPAAAAVAPAGGLFASNRGMSGGLLGNARSSSRDRSGSIGGSFGGLFGNVRGTTSSARQPSQSASGLFGRSNVVRASSGGGLFGAVAPAATMSLPDEEASDQSCAATQTRSSAFGSSAFGQASLPRSLRRADVGAAPLQENQLFERHGGQSPFTPSAALAPSASLFGTGINKSVAMSQEDAMEEAEESDEDMGYGLFDNDSCSAPTAAVPKSQARAQNPLQDVIRLQTFEGYWKWNDELWAAMGIDKGKAMVFSTGLGWDRNVIATLLAVAFFEHKLSDDKDAWELVVEKAKGWLEQQMGGKMEGALTQADTVMMNA